MRELLKLMLLSTLLFSGVASAELLPIIPSMDRGMSVEEEDGSPSVWDVRWTKTPNDGMTDNLDGSISLDYYPTGSADDTFVLKAGDTMTGALGVIEGAPAGDKLYVGGDVGISEDLTIGDDLTVEGSIDTPRLEYPAGQLTFNDSITGVKTLAELATSAGDPDQNLWETIATDGTSVTANTTTDTLTIAGGGINVTSQSGDTITVTGTEVDGSTSNEINTITTPDTEVTVGLAITFADTGIMTITESADTITFDATEVDGSTSNEINTIQGDDDGATSGLAISIDGAGIVTTDVVGDVLTVTGTEVDGSTSNEINTVQGDDNTPTSGLAISIDGGEGIDTDVIGDILTVAGEDASDSNKGIATFNNADFAVASGDVTIKTDGVSDTQANFGQSAGQINASDIPIALGTGSPTVDQLQEYFDNTGSSGYFTGGILSDGGSGTLDISAGEGFIRTTADDNAPLLSFKWTASTGVAVADDTTQYVYVNSNGTKTLSTNEFLEAANKIQIGVVTDEGGATIHVFQLGVRLEESIGAAGRFIRRVHGIARNNRLGGLIFVQSGDANRDVTITAGELEWGRTTYIITSFDTSGADTFSTYSATGQEAAAASLWDNDNYDNAGTLTSLGNNRWANLFFWIEPDDHIVMAYGRAQFNSQALAEGEGVPTTSLPSKITATGILAARFTFQKGSNTAVISSAFDTLFANAGVTSHPNLANLAWTSAGHTGTANTIAAFDGAGAASEISDSAGLLAALDDETGTALAVFSTNPTFAGLYSTANVGIGTTSPVGLLDVNALLTVLSGGNVGIGTTLPAAKIDIYGNIAISGVVGSDNQILKMAGSTLGWEADAGGGASFGAENQIPSTNAATDDFDYSAIHTFDGTDLRLKANSSKIYFGAADDGYIEHDGNSLNIFADTQVATDDIELHADVLFFQGSSENILWDMSFASNEHQLSSQTGAELRSNIRFYWNDGKEIVFGTQDDAYLFWNTTGNDNLALTTPVGNASFSGYISIMETIDRNNANRQPTDTVANPTLRIYSSDAAQATDYIQFSHNQVDALIQSGTGTISFDDDNLTTSGTIEGATITEGGNAVYNTTESPIFTGMALTGTLTMDGVETDFTTDTNEHLSLMPNGTGNVGIGTTSPTGIFHVGIGATAPQALFVKSSDGNVGIGTTNPTSLLHVNGIIETASNIRSTPRHLIVNVFDPLGVQTDDTQVCIWPLTPAALTITKITVTLDASGNEVAGDLKYADTFIGLANPVVINVFDTDSGVLEDDTITSGSVAAGKTIYIQWDSAPNTAITQQIIDVQFDYD